jgi:DNA-binding MarR family transcriptional regulator
MKIERAPHKDFAELISRLVRSLSLLDWTQKACCGTTMSQCYTIETLARRGTLPMNALSREMGVSVSTMTRVVDVLVRNGVVRRRPAPGDRRRVCVELTVEGQALAKRFGCCGDGYSSQILDRVPAEARKGVLRSLGILADALEGIRAENCKCGGEHDETDK